MEILIFAAYGIIILFMFVICGLLYLFRLNIRYISVIFFVGFICLSVAVWEMLIFPYQGWSDGPMLNRNYVICVCITIFSAFLLFFGFYALKTENCIEIFKMGVLLLITSCLFGALEDYYCWILNKLYYFGYKDNNIFELFILWLQAHPFFIVIFPVTALWIIVIICLCKCECKG